MKNKKRLQKLEQDVRKGQGTLVAVHGLLDVDGDFWKVPRDDTLYTEAEIDALAEKLNVEDCIKIRIVRAGAENAE